MSQGHPMSIKKRFLLLTGISVFSLIVLFAVILYTERNLLIQDRQEKVRNLVESVHTLVGSYEAQAREGKMSVDDAKAAAINAVRQLRYEKTEYFWINDLNGLMIMHPIKPAMNGTNVSGLKDPTGKLFFQEFVDLVKAKGDGYVSYLWPKAGAEAPVPKISYVKGFTQWNWLIGTGIYIDDVDVIFKQEALKLAGWGLFIFALIAGSLLLASRSIMAALGCDPQVAKAITQRIAAGDLSTDIHPQAGDSTSLLVSMKSMQDTLRNMIGEIIGNAGQISSAATQLQRNAEEVSHSAKTQSDAASSIAAAMEEMTVSIDHVADNTNEAHSISLQSSEYSEQGKIIINNAASEVRKIAEAVQASSAIIEELGDQSDQITSIVNTIKEIADQTNLLALNAAIEAARAGEAGRGFAVVADEVRKLAERTTQSTQEIGATIGKIQAGTRNAVSSMELGVTQVDKGVELASEAGVSINQILQGAQRVTAVVNDITAAMREQSSASSEIAGNIEEIARMSEESSHAIEEASVAAGHLHQLSDNLQRSVARFRTS